MLNTFKVTAIKREDNTVELSRGIKIEFLVQDRFNNQDLLEANLRVLLSNCDSISLAKVEPQSYVSIGGFVF